MANVLIIDDDQNVCNLMNSLVIDMAHNATCARSLKEGYQKAYSEEFDLVFLDVWMPDGNGLDILPKIQETRSLPQVVIMTGNGDPDGAELAIKSGAWDYIEKPFTNEKIALSLTCALQYRIEKQSEKQAVSLERGEIIGESPQMRHCLDLLAKGANSHLNVLITGETGTGKELFAQAIHNNSSRRHKNFVVVDCAALPETLVQSTLFGHEKGAFTGADRAQEGLIKQADGGTLFLDEVGELPLSVQRAFLRVLQEHRFRPVGGKKEIKSDFKLVSATNLSLDQAVKAGKFRRDLLFRLRSLVIGLPVLAERTGDIRKLMMHHLTKLCDRYGMGKKEFSPEFFEAFASYSWPGNVRELIGVLENIIATAGNAPVLFPKHLPTHVRVEVARASIAKKDHSKLVPQKDSSASAAIGKLKDYRQAAVAKAESQYLNNLILATRGNIRQACRLSGLSRPRLYALMKIHHISRPR
jgi:two-component system NtrC family response regulator